MIQLGILTRNARLDAIASQISNTPILKILEGSPVSNCATTDTQDVLVSMTLPSTWLASAASGAISKSGAWTGTASADGIAGHWRIFEATGTTCFMQGTVGVTGDGTDIELDNTSIASGQTITISTFTITDGNS